MIDSIYVLLSSALGLPMTSGLAIAPTTPKPHYGGPQAREVTALSPRLYIHLAFHCLTSTTHQDIKLDHILLGKSTQ